MRRLVPTALAGALALAVAAGAPAGATAAAPQDSVRHIANVPGTTGSHVAVEGDRLYMGNYGLGMTIYDVSDPAAPALLGSWRPGNRVVADATPDAAHYPERKIAVLGGTSRAPGTQTTDFLDVTDPANPVLLAQTTGGTEGEAHNADLVDERKLYLPSGGGFRIFDISPLLAANPAKPSLVFNGNLHTMWNESPFRTDEPIGPSFSHIHDVQVYTDYSVLLPEDQWVDQDGDEIPDPTYADRDIALIAEGGGYELGAAGSEGDNGGVYVVDITDPAAPVVMERWRHPANFGQSSDQKIRYYHEVQLLDSDPHVMIVTDEDLHTGTCADGGIATVRLSEDLTQTEYLAEWLIPENTTPGVCSAHVFSTAGPYMFMGSYNAGLQVVDLSDPAAPEQAGQFIIEGANSWGALYHEGYIYTGDFGGRGLDVFEFIPDPAGKGLVTAGNPASGQVPGISETAAACDSSSPANGIDGFWVDIPAEKRDGTHTLRALGSDASGAYDVDVWFYDANCEPMDLNLTHQGFGDEEGPIPDGAAFAAVGLFAGAPQWVYAQIDPLEL